MPNAKRGCNLAVVRSANTGNTFIICHPDVRRDLKVQRWEAGGYERLIREKMPMRL